jgi:hypothetical protein
VPYPEYIELFDSASGTLSLNDDGTLAREVPLKWLVPNKATYLACEEWAADFCPIDYNGHRRTRLECRSLGNRWWEVSAVYTNTAIKADGGDDQNGDNGGAEPIANTVAFDTTGGTEHITSAINGGSPGFQGEEVHTRPGETENIVYFDGAINVDGESVNGLDIVVPTFNFTETWTMPAAFLIDKYVETLYSLTGTVNDGDFRVFKQGECLFLGARAEMTRGQTLVSVTYQFSARPNKENFEVGSGDSAIEVNYKRGWDYMWIRYEPKVSENTLIRRPASVHVNQVYDRKNFGLLSIGTTFPKVHAPSSTFDNGLGGRGSA